MPDTGKNQSAAGGWSGDGPKEFSALTVSEAVDLACAELGIDRDNLTYEIRDSGLLSILGFDSKLATIVVHACPRPEVAGGSPSATVSEQRSASKSLPPRGLEPHVLQEAARRFKMTRSAVRHKIWSGELVYDPNRHRLVETSDSQAGTEESQRNGSYAEESGKLPRGYWTETNRMILLLKQGEKKLLWRIVERLEQTIQAVVCKVREKTKPSGLEEEDLLQIGRIEIISLIEGYDPRLGTNTSAYMRQWLYHRIMRVIDDNMPVRVPANFGSSSDLEQRAAFFRSPTTYEQLEEIPEDAFVGEEEGFEEVLREDLYRKVVSSAPLSERHHYVLVNRYGLNGTNERTLEQVGADFGMTRERIRQLQLQAIEALKEHLYLSCGLNTGVDLSSRRLRFRTPERVFPAVLRDDFSLGKPPEPQPSISAVQEWTGSILPH